MTEWITISRFAALPLVVILMTAVWGLNEIRKFAGDGPLALNRHTAKEGGLAVSYIALGSASGLMLWGIWNGIEVITWRGAFLVFGASGVFIFFGKFRPWARWIRRTVPVDRYWSDKAHPSSEDLAALAAELRIAYRLGAQECLKVMPKAIAAIETLAAERPEIERLRSDMVSVVSELRHRLRESSKFDPETSRHMEDILTRLDRAARRTNV